MTRPLLILLMVGVMAGCSKKPEAVPQPIPQKVVTNKFINQFKDVDSIDIFLHFKDGSFIDVRSPEAIGHDYNLKISSQGVIHVPKDIPHERIYK